MNKITFIKNKPVDEADLNSIGTTLEDGIKSISSSVYNPGVIGGLQVSYSGSNLGIAIAPGSAFDSSYNLIKVNISDNTKALTTANPTNPRIDLVVIQFNTTLVNNTDSTNKYGYGTSYIYSQQVLDSYTIAVVPGTAAVSPTVPATPANSVALASILLPAGATSIIPGNITDLRTLITLKASISIANLTNGSITDALIGNRTISDTVTASSGADTPTNLWSKLANMIKAITGKANWYTPPVTTIEALNTAMSTRAASDSPVFTNSASLAAAPTTGNHLTNKTYVDAQVAIAKNYAP
jgi:hypothetical protein